MSFLSVLASAALSVFVANYSEIKLSIFGLLANYVSDINFLYLLLVARIILHDFHIFLHIPSRKLAPLEVNTKLNSLIPATESVFLQFEKSNWLITKYTNFLLNS